MEVNNLSRLAKKYRDKELRKKYQKNYTAYLDRKNKPLVEVHSTLPLSKEEIEEKYKEICPKSPIKSGIVQITMLLAHDLKKGKLGGCNPFCRISVEAKVESKKNENFETQVAETPVDSEHGSDPTWNLSYQFKVSDMYNDCIKFEFFNKQKIGGTLPIGWAYLPLQVLPMTVPLQFTMLVQGKDRTLSTKSKTKAIPGDFVVIVQALNFGLDYSNFMDKLHKNNEHYMKQMNQTYQGKLNSEYLALMKQKSKNEKKRKDVFSALMSVFNISGAVVDKSV